jgi:hypothetical protein
LSGGSGTLYGDAQGALSLIRDPHKLEVFALERRRAAPSRRRRRAFGADRQPPIAAYYGET